MNLKTLIGAAIISLGLLSPSIAQTSSTRAQLESQNNANITSNGTGAITGAKLNAMIGNLAASAMTLLDNNAPAGGQFFGSGQPWVDVRSGANGCPAAVPGPADAQPAIQCQLTYMYNTFGGGVVYFPPGPGNYNIHSGLTVKGDIQLVGVGVTTTNLVVNGDFTALTFDSTATWSSLRDMTVVGTNLISQPPTTNLVSVANGISVFFERCSLKGGFWALQTGGSDGDVRDCSIEGFGAAGGGVLSSGANTYYDAKIDNNDVSTQAAFRQVAFYAGDVTGENRIVNSDTSGLYVNSLEINDTFNQAITSIVNTVIAQPVSITGAAQTMFANIEFGSAAFANVGVTTIIGSSGVGVTVAPAGGTINCVGQSNTNIICPALSVANGGTGLATLTAHSVLLGEGAGNLAFATIGTGGKILTDQGAGADPAFEAVSGDCTFSLAGVMICTKTNGTSFGALATITPGVGIATALGNSLASDATNVASTLVARDGSGNFAAGTITASLTGHSSLDLALTGGALTGAVTLANNIFFSFKDNEGTTGGSIGAGAGDNVFFTAGNGATCSPNCLIGLRDFAGNTVFQLVNGSATPTLAIDYVNDMSTLEASSIAAGGSAFYDAGGMAVAKKFLGGSSILSNSASGGVGYTTGSGGTVTQATSKSTAITLNAVGGAITMNNAALASGAIVTFTWANSSIAATDVIATNHISGGTTGAYAINCRATGSGTAACDVRNASAGSLSEAIVIEFSVGKVTTSELEPANDNFGAKDMAA